MKNIVLFIILIISLNGISQNLESKIPANSKAVISVNGNQIFDLITMNDINNISSIKNLLKMEKIESVADFGFNVKSKAFYFFQMLDTVKYHNFIVNLSDNNKFEKLVLKNEIKNIEEDSGYKFAFESDKVIAWNDEILLVSIINLPRKPYDYSYNPYETSPPPVQEEIEENKSEDFIEEEKPNTETVKKEEYPSVKKVDTYREYPPLIDETTKILLKNNVLSILNNKSSNSILTNKNYISGKNSKSSSYLWVSNYSDIIANYMSSEMGSYSPYGKMDFSKGNIFGINEIVANLYFNDDEVKVTSAVTVDKKWVEMFKKMYNSSLNKKFFKYINKNETLAYFSAAINTQAMLEQYPKMMTNIYGSILPKFKEETEVVADLISVILDEKAIGELITGDALFVLNDIAEKEVSYTSYTYDDDYNRSEITKTKMEVIPDFTIMLGSNNKTLINKLMSLAVKYKVVEKDPNFFKFDKNTTKAPFDMFFTVKDGIAFLTNSYKQMKSISSNNFPTNIGSHKKLLKKNIAVFYLDSKKIMSKVPDTYLSNKQKDFLKYANNNIDETYFTYSKLKGNKFYANHIIKTNEKQGNSLKLILNLIEEFSH